MFATILNHEMCFVTINKSKDRPVVLLPQDGAGWLANTYKTLFAALYISLNMYPLLYHQQ